MGVFFREVKRILQIEHSKFKSQKSKLDAHQLAIDKHEMSWTGVYQKKKQQQLQLVLRVGLDLGTSRSPVQHPYNHYAALDTRGTKFSTCAWRLTSLTQFQMQWDEIKQRQVPQHRSWHSSGQSYWKSKAKMEQ